MPTRLVAGGATGIGRAAILAFLAQGDDVLLADLNETGGTDLAGEVATAGHGSRFEFLRADLLDERAPDAIVEAAVKRFGRLDTMFANAGVIHSAPLAEWRLEDWERSVRINLTSPFLLAKAAAGPMAEAGGGSIILTSSTGALRGHARMHAYHATKSGLLGLVRSLADELAPSKIRVNALLPGFIDTPFNAPFWAAQDDPDAAERELAAAIPMRRQGSPEDVAGTVLFLASDASAYVTGTQIVVDGGYSAV